MHCTYQVPALSTWNLRLFSLRQHELLPSLAWQERLKWSQSRVCLSQDAPPLMNKRPALESGLPCDHDAHTLSVATGFQDEEHKLLWPNLSVWRHSLTPQLCLWESSERMICQR
ncbi:hypothetical protein BS78_03G271000 [Paspalum vaginatum]|nr:hypothetical protein BS78_03G271000 [Paspalum vaginatum]KAJ1285322.1 hypothetical protein BS78_03G271000 [Paspalum vaginatum]